MIKDRHGFGIVLTVIPLTTIVSHAFGRSTYPLLLPAIIDDLPLSTSVAGLGGSIMFVSYLIGVLTATAVSRSLTPATTMKAGLGLVAVGLLIEAVSRSAVALFAGIGLTGIGGAAIWLTAPLLVTEGLDAARRGTAVGIVTGAVGFGTSVVALVTRSTRAWADQPSLWRPVFMLEGIFSLLVLALVALLIRSQLGRSSGRHPLSTIPLRRMKDWIPITVAYALFGAVASGFASFLAEALESDGELARSTVATIYLVFGAGAVIGAPLAGWVSDRVGRRPVMVVVMALIAVVCFSVAFLHGWLLIVTVGALGGLWPTYPTLTATYVRDHVPEGDFATTFGTMTILFSLAAVMPPLASGVLADSTGSFTLAYAVLGALAVGAAALLLVPSGTPHPELVA